MAVSLLVTYLLKSVISSTAHRNINVLLHCEITQEILIHSINVYRFSFRQKENYMRCYLMLTIKYVCAPPFSELPIY